MSAKRKRDKVPRSHHHPSQSSVAVPLQIKKDLKIVQDNRCWLCDCKAHKKLRPFEVCHLYPQATAKRFSFIKRHKLGQIHLYNIHDRGNLIGLCSICHLAFDNGEWTFVPEETTDWIPRIKAAPQTIQEYNAQRSIVFRRLLLEPDPDSKAFQDTYYKSAFTDNPTKIWLGEVGALMIRPPYEPPAEPTAELQETLEGFDVLKKLWLASKSPCSEENCPICQSKSDGKQGEEDDTDDEDDEDEDEDEDDDEDDGDDDEEEDNDNSDRNIEDSKEDEKRKKDTSSSSKKKRKTPSKKQAENTGQQSPPPPLQAIKAKKSTKVRKRRKPPSKNVSRGWMTSAPYDESIPISHRHGYTWANTTSNDLMEMWQAYRK